MVKENKKVEFDTSLEEGGGSLWDYAATACLFEEMGSFARDSFGEILDLNSRDSLFMNRKGVLFASHKEIINTIRCSKNETE